MKKFREFMTDLLEMLLISIVIVFLLRIFVLMPVVVDGRSMEPLLTNGDRGFSFVITRRIGLERFDIVIVENEKTDGKLVKRIIGMPGETIRCSGNQIYIDGELLEQPFLQDVYTSDFEYVLAEDEYFCLGDNRDVSRDSRYYGPFRDKEILASHIFLIWPLQDIGWRE
ncbi:MAG: signal peptidase I [Erysipelotrichaceae bacterium]|nr:signal peptidase I [Erysipelotrichaceae bacterium]MBQ1810480.1 signal peptidase I [Erysipelotrichaceae bacterium]